MRQDELLRVPTSFFVLHGIPPTQTLIGGRRLASEETFPVLDRYTQVKVAIRWHRRSASRGWRLAVRPRLTIVRESSRAWAN